ILELLGDHALHQRTQVLPSELHRDVDTPEAQRPRLGVERDGDIRREDRRIGESALRLAPYHQRLERNELVAYEAADAVSYLHHILGQIEIHRQSSRTTVWASRASASLCWPSRGAPVRYRVDVSEK